MFTSSRVLTLRFQQTIDLVTYFPYTWLYKWFSKKPTKEFLIWVNILGHFLAITLKCSLSSSKILPTTTLKFGKIESKSSSISKYYSWSIIFSTNLKSFSSCWLICKLFSKSLSKTFKYISKNYTCLSLTCFLNLWMLV